MANPHGRPKGAKSNPNRLRIPFKQSEIVRAIKSVKSMGLPIERIEIHPTTGTITITPGKAA